MHLERPIDPLTLQLYVAVCEEGHIARAAERQALVASAVSKRLTALEHDLGVSLLVRHRRGIELTPAGEALLRRARELLDGMGQLRAEVSAYAQGMQGSLRVLASASILADRLPEDVARHMAAEPGVRVQLDERTGPEIVRAVREGHADLGVLWDVADLSGLQALPYRGDRLRVALPVGHAWAHRPGLRYAECIDAISVSVAPGGLMDVLLRRQAALLGRPLAYRFQVAGLAGACRVVSAGLGLAILPDGAAAPHADAGRLRLVRLDEPWASRRFVVCSRPDPQTSAPARRLREHLQWLAGSDL